MRLFYVMFLLGCLSVGELAAQCVDCTADETCGNGESFPTLCPEVLVNAVAGEYYEQTITFYLPAEVNTGDIVATLEEVLVLSVVDLPFGMELTINDDDLTFFPSQGDTFGCATLCGTPVLAGVYDITINVQVIALAFGFEQVFVQGFTAPLIVEPGESSNSSFSLNSNASCGELSLEAISLIDGSPNPTEYLWDFGNGNINMTASPSAEEYNAPGDYTVSLTTTIYQYELDALILSSISQNGDADLDELFGALSPDPYVVVLDGDGTVIFTSPAIVDVETATFIDLGVILSPEFDEYVVQIWDEDTLTDDDLLGQFTVSSTSEGTETFNDDGSEGTYNINYEVNTQFFNEEVVTVFPLPNSELIFSEGQQTLSIIPEEGMAYQWFLNSESLLSETMNSVELEEPGIYQCEITNEFGCSSFTEEFTVCPEVEIGFNANMLSVDEGFDSYIWSYNGLVLPAEDGPVLEYQGDGNYSVEITTFYGCVVDSEVFTVISSVSELEASIGLELYPNPAADVVYIKPSDVSSPVHVEIYAANGQLVYSELRNTDFSEKVQLDVSKLPAGIYSVVVKDKTGRVSQRSFMK